MYAATFMWYEKRATKHKKWLSKRENDRRLHDQDWIGGSGKTFKKNHDLIIAAKNEQHENIVHFQLTHVCRGIESQVIRQQPISKHEMSWNMTLFTCKYATYEFNRY